MSPGSCGQSGSEKAGAWQTGTRNIREDYRAAFGEEAPPITGKQSMTNSDNTRKSAEAVFDTIIFNVSSR